MIAIWRAAYSSMPMATSDQNRAMFEKSNGSWIKTGRRALLFQQAKPRLAPGVLKGLPILLSESAGDYISKALVNRDVEQLGS
jgi:hypothetical protein